MKVNVSAVVPSYNRRNYIRRAIDSILAQSVPVFEIVVVDDGSTDGTAEAVEEWYGNKVRVIRQENGGVAAARRRGIQESRGDWVAFLDSDDEWTSNRNELLVKAVQNMPTDVALIFGDLRIVTDVGDNTTLFEEHGLKLRESPHVFANSLDAQFPFQFSMLQGSLIRRQVLVELQCFSIRLKSDDDLLAGFQIACSYKMAAIGDVVGKYYRTSDLASSSVMNNGVYGPDYFRSRMMAFELVIKMGRGTKPWNSLYGAAARDLAKLQASSGKSPRKLALQQFRYGAFSAKAFAFLCVAVFGCSGIRAWSNLTLIFRRIRPHSQLAPRGHLQSSIRPTKQ